MNNKKLIHPTEAADILNKALEQSFMASGIAYLNSNEPSWPTAHVYGEEGCQWVELSGVEYRIAFGVGCRVDAGYSADTRLRLSVSWGSGGIDAPHAKSIMHQKAIEAVTLYHAALEEFTNAYEISVNAEVLA